MRAQVRLRNFGDVEAARRGFIDAKMIRSSNLNMLVDTGAVLSFLPQDEVEKLGLECIGRVIVTYADERREERPVARGVELMVGDRTMVTDCVVGPPLCEPLLGQIVLEQLDLVVRCSDKTLAPSPDSPNLPLLKLK